MVRGVQFFSTPREVEGFFDQFFGGLFIIAGLPFLLFLSWVLLLVGATLLLRSNRRGAQCLSQALSYLAFCFSLPLLFQPWDEIFINFRHSLHLAEFGTFSFNQFSKIEGTVDFLPYFLVGLLGKIGLPVAEMGWLQGMLGGIICIGFGSRILGVFTGSDRKSLHTLLLSLFPPLGLNAANGFATAFFAGAVMVAVDLLFFSRRIVWGFFCLSLLPLIRTEGGLLTFCLGAVFAGRNLKRWIAVAISFIPVGVLSLWRYHEFGDIVPVPIHYKATLWSLFYSLIGVRTFLGDVTASGAVLAATVLWFANQSKVKILEWRALLALLAFTIPYYFAGGDWFPSSWGRYFLPFSFLIYVYAVGAAENMAVKKKWTPKTLGICVAIACLCVLPPYHSLHRYLEQMTLPRPTLATLSIRYENRAYYRIQQLSQVGSHLRQVMEPRDRIGTSEVATISYFAQKETIDFLGVANPEVAQSPIRPTPPIFRIREKRPHLPYMIFRKVNPAILARELPEVLYTFDFFPGILIKEIPQAEWGEKEVKLAVKRWLERYQDLVEPLYGGNERLLELGYTPVVVRYGEDFMTCYYVSKTAREKHFKKMQSMKFMGQWVPL